MSHIKVIKLWQADNAGCYISQDLKVFLHAVGKICGLPIQQAMHTEAQDGKTCLDAHFAHVMDMLRRYVAEGHDLLVAEDVFAGLCHLKIQGSFPALVTLDRSFTPPRATAWPDIRRLSHWLFKEDGSVTVREQSNIGPGLTRDQSYVQSRIQKDSKYIFSGTGVTFQEAEPAHQTTHSPKIRRLRGPGGPGGKYPKR
eukprot:Pompholyxophrys_sp_v1_NODE_97_length_2040_cov_8.574811.p2 type:complete len:198 gc:universal NODE_97_length_2040_cov_8.574811:1340-747(-)